MTIRQYSTYFPLWLPVKKRSQIVSDMLAARRYARLTSMLTCEWRAQCCALEGPGNNIKAMLFTAARMGLPVFEKSDDDWQSVNAEVLVDLANRRLNDSSFKVAQDYLSLDKFLKFTMNYSGLHPKSPRLRFKWAGIFGEIDVDALHEYISSASHLFASMRNRFERRINDTRYVFATKRKCPLPAFETNDLREANDETLALVIDWLLSKNVDRWSLAGARQPDFGLGYPHNSPRDRRDRCARLKGWLIETMLGETSEELYNRLLQLTKDAEANIREHKPYFGTCWGETPTEAAFRRYDIPEPQATQLLQLLEEYDEAQRPRQPEPLPESLGRDDGTEVR